MQPFCKPDHILTGALLTEAERYRILGARLRTRSSGKSICVNTVILPSTAGTESIDSNQDLLGRERAACHDSNGPLLHVLAEKNSRPFEKIAPAS